MTENINAPALQESASITASSLIMNGGSFDRVMSLAKIMAKGSATIPKHFQGNESDCAAIIMQSMQWGMNPFAVAQKTFITPNGLLSYEAQLVNAVINSIGPLDGRPSYRFIGNWEKIIGRVKEMKNDKGGKYYLSDWNQADETGLGVVVCYKIKGESERELEVLLKQCWPRFSTQWATDPKQQICYAAIKKVARREFPDVILGVYTADEMDSDPGERIVNPSPVDDKQPEPEAKTVVYYPEEPFLKSFPKWKTAIEKGTSTNEVWINTLTAKYPLTDDQIARINEVKSPIQGEVVTDANTQS